VPDLVIVDLAAGRTVRDLKRRRFAHFHLEISADDGRLGPDRVRWWFGVAAVFDEVAAVAICERIRIPPLIEPFADKA
jgi:hypothetical protein